MLNNKQYQWKEHLLSFQILMCISPCLTCSAQNFYSCLSCEDTGQSLVGSLCLYPSTIYYQITTTVLAIIFIIPILMRKRCLVLIKILDFIQLASYFKLIKGYAPNRQIWLYLNMRGWGTFDQGWDLISADPTIPIWTNQQGTIDKCIRIASIWGLMSILIIIIGVLKVVLDEHNLTFGRFMSMNIGNTVSFAFYFTVQDLAFIAASSLLNMSFNSTLDVVAFSLGIFFCLVILLVLVWCFYRINFRDIQEKYYYYKYFFLLSCDYDLFPTYELLSLPSESKQIHKYSNLRIVDVIKKIGYSFLIVAYLSDPSYSDYVYLDQVYQILAYILAFQIIWFIVMPFDIKKQFIQFIIMILAFLVTLYLLFAPWYLNNEIVHTALVLSLFGLALVSLILEVCLNIYKLIPVDLYDVGLKVVIEDAHLLKQIAIRRKEQQLMQKKLKQIEEQNEKMKKQMSKSKKYTGDKTDSELEQLPKQKQVDNREDSEISLGRNSNEQKQYEAIKIEPEVALDKQSMNSQQIAQLYKVDELKRRKVYQWNKQKPFSYSNKIQ